MVTSGNRAPICRGSAAGERTKPSKDVESEDDFIAGMVEEQVVGDFHFEMLDFSAVSGLQSGWENQKPLNPVDL